MRGFPGLKGRSRAIGHIEGKSDELPVHGDKLQALETQCRDRLQTTSHALVVPLLALILTAKECPDTCSRFLP
jgi:hypothetical protein